MRVVLGGGVIKLRILRDKTAHFERRGECPAGDWTQGRRSGPTGSALHAKGLAALLGSDALAPQGPTAAAWHHFPHPGGRDALAVV